MSRPREPLFSFPFLELCLFNFAASAAVFAMLPVAPYRIHDLGGPTEAAGLFLGGLTFASALSAPFTGALGDRLGQGRVLAFAATAIAALFAIYAFVLHWPLFVGLAILQGIFWSALLTSSGAYAVRLIPETRRAEGLSIHGMATVLAISLAPSVGFVLVAQSWRWLTFTLAAVNAAIAILALRFVRGDRTAARDEAPLPTGDRLAKPVLRFAVGLFLVSLGYGGLTSFAALYTEYRGVAPRGLYFIAFAGTMLALRPFIGKWIDRVGPFNALRPSIVAVAIALSFLPLAETRPAIVACAILYGLGFAAIGPAFTTYVIGRVAPARRGAAFGVNIAAFDTGIGSGSILFGPVIAHAGFAPAFAIAAVAAISSWPYFTWARKRFEAETPV
ncbi:MAG: MFS transporter [Thermoanaerobaculia bacterium]